MTTLPSPPLSPLSNSYTPAKLMTPSLPERVGYQRKGHHRHPDRRRDTFELIQALVIEHQRLEQQEFEAMLREAPSISCRYSSKAPNSILVNNGNNSNNNNNNNSSSSNKNSNNIPLATTMSTKTTTTTSLPPQSPHDEDHLRFTTMSSASPNGQSSSPSGLKLSSAFLSKLSFPGSPSLPSSASSSPSLSCPSSTSFSASSSSSSNSSHSTHVTRPSVVRFAPGPPKVYRYPKLATQQGLDDHH